MRKEKRISKKRIMAVILVVVLLLAAAGIWYILALRSTQELLIRTADMSFDDLMKEALANRKDACVTVGVLKDGQMSFDVYGEGAGHLDQTEYRYEIGSITKTMTAALIGRAVLEGKLQLTDTIDKYLDLPTGKVYPTIESLLTHTSGLNDGDFYEWSMLPHVFRHETNPFLGITGEDILREYSEANLEDGKAYGFSYSNYGFALLGLVLEDVYGADCTSLLNAYLADELAMQNTYVSSGDADFSGNWQWKDGDAYIPAGAVVSDITDMLLYAQAQLDGDPALTLCHQPLKQVDASDKWKRMAGFCVDKIGMSWIIDTENGIIWHNGATGMHTSYLGFCPEKNMAVAVLSNLSQDEDIQTTTIGFRKLLEVCNSQNG